MHNKIQVEQRPYQPHIPDNHPDTFGRLTVVDDIESNKIAISADKIEDRITWREEITERKQHPAELTRSQRVLGRLGLGEKPLMSRKEVREFDYVADLDSTVVQTARESAEKKRNAVKDDLLFTRKALRWLKTRSSTTQSEVEATIIESMSDFQFGQYADRRDKFSDLSALEWLIANPAADMPDSTVDQKHTKEAQQIEDDQKLLNFLQAHNHYIAARQQSYEFKEVVEREKEIWSSGVERGVREGWLHENATEQLTRVASVQVFEGDYFTTLFQGRGGYYRQSDANIVAVARNQAEEATVHELNHALLQVFPEAQYMEMNKPWLFEAITEEISLIMKGDELGEFNLGHGAYREERKLLRDFIEVAQQLGADVTLADFTRAYSAPSEEQYEIIDYIQDRIYDAGFPTMRLLVYVDHLLNNAMEDIKISSEENKLSQRERQILATNRVSKEVRSWSKGIAQNKKKAIS